MYELLWLLLPVAAAGGWLAGRRNAIANGPDRFWSDATSYHRDLHSLLNETGTDCLLYTSPSPRDATLSRMPSSS